MSIKLKTAKAQGFTASTAAKDKIFAKVSLVVTSGGSPGDISPPEGNSPSEGKISNSDPFH